MKKLSLLALLGAMCLSLLLVGCGGGGGSSLGGTSIGGGASKAPIVNGKVYINGVYVTDTDTSGNFTLGSLGYSAADYPLTVQIRGGQSTIGGTVKTYAADQVVLDGYMFSGDTTVYLSALSMMQKRYVDAGLSREEAQSRVIAVFNTIASLVGFDVSGVTAGDNPTATDAFEVVQQGLLSFLGVDESTSADIGSALGSALSTNLTGATDAASFNTALGNVATAVVNNRTSIIQAAAAARGTTLSLDSSKIQDAVVGLNVWHTQDASTYAQGGTIYVDLNATLGNLTLTFDLNRNNAGAASGSQGGALKLAAATGTIAADSSAHVNIAAIPTMDNSLLSVNKGGGAIAAGDNVNGSLVNLVFARNGKSDAVIWAALNDTLTVRFYAEDNTAISQAYTIRFYDSRSQSTVEDVDFRDASFGPFNASSSTKPLYVDASHAFSTTITPANLKAHVNWSGADNLDGVFMRFLAPAGFKFNRSGWSAPSRNLDIQTMGISSDADNNATKACDDSTLTSYSSAISLVADATAQPVGEKSFTVEVKDKTTNQVLASDSKSVYITTQDSLNHIKSIDLNNYGSNATNDELENGGVPPVAYNPLGAFAGSVTTWGTASGQVANCSAAVYNNSNASWKLRLWYFNSSATAGFSRDGSTWAQNLDVLSAGSAVVNNAAVAIASDCGLTVTPGDNAQFQPYYISGTYNRDKVSAVYTYDAAGSTSDFSITSDPLTFKTQ